MKKKDNFCAKIAFFFSLGFWIPLFNVGLCIISIYLAVKALKLIDKDNKKYGGKGYALFGLVVSISALIGTLIFYVTFLVLKLSYSNLSPLP